MSTTSTEPARPVRRRPPAGRAPAVAVAVFAAVVVLLGVVSLIGVAVSVTERSTRTFTGVTEVDVETGSGDVEVTVGDRPDVRVEVTTERSWARPRLRQAVEAGVLRLSGRCRFLFGECSVSYRIELPSATPVRLETGSGDITVAGLHAWANAETGSGDVQVRDVTGAVRAQTGSGNVTLDLVTGDVRARTGSGDIVGHALRAPTIQGQTGSGSIRLIAVSTAPSEVLLSTGSGDVGLTVPDAVYRVAAHTSSGDVDTSGMRQDPASPRRIEVRTGSGDILVRSG